MSHQASTYSDAPPIDAGAQVAHLRHVLGQVEEIAASKNAASADRSLDEAARISITYERALPVACKRFDALAEETIAWAAVALQALEQAGKRNGPPRAAAAQLTLELKAALRALARTIAG